MESANGGTFTTCSDHMLVVVWKLCQPKALQERDMHMINLICMM